MSTGARRERATDSAGVLWLPGKNSAVSPFTFSANGSAADTAKSSTAMREPLVFRSMTYDCPRNW